jgi:plastocyanin
MKCITAFVVCMFLLSPVFAADPPASQIAINEYMYAPATLNISAGTKVTWVNHDEVPHTIVDSGPDKVFHSAALDTDETYSYTFTKPGTYHYFCTLHPKMVGTIVVADAK